MLQLHKFRDLNMHFKSLGTGMIQHYNFKRPVIYFTLFKILNLSMYMPCAS
jgi:hypothetical protein